MFLQIKYFFITFNRNISQNSNAKTERSKSSTYNNDNITLRIRYIQGGRKGSGWQTQQQTRGPSGAPEEAAGIEMPKESESVDKEELFYSTCDMVTQVIQIFSP